MYTWSSSPPPSSSYFRMLSRTSSSGSMRSCLAWRSLSLLFIHITNSSTSTATQEWRKQMRTHEDLSEHQWVSMKGFRDHQLFHVSLRLKEHIYQSEAPLQTPHWLTVGKKTEKRPIHWHTEPSHSHRYIRYGSVRYVSWSGPSMMLHWGPVLSKHISLP